MTELGVWRFGYAMDVSFYSVFTGFITLKRIPTSSPGHEKNRYTINRNRTGIRGWKFGVRACHAHRHLSQILLRKHGL